MDLKRTRMKYTHSQTALLERQFGLSHYPDTETQEKLAADIGVSTDRISIWFQNRRSKFKRQCHTHHVTWMRKQIFKPDNDKCYSFGTPRLPVQTPACHVLSPLESQVHRNDVSVISSPDMFSPIGTSFCQEPNVTTNNTAHVTPEVFHRPYSCTVRTSGPCMVNNRIVPLNPETNYIGHEGKPNRIQDRLADNVSCLGLSNRQSDATSSCSNDFISCSANRQLPRNLTRSHGGLVDITNKQIPTHRGYTLFGNNSRTHFTERLSNADESYEPDIPLTPTWSRDEEQLAPRWSRVFAESGQQHVIDSFDLDFYSDIQSILF